MSFFLAILGLALLVMIHEAGHFFAARAVGMTPRKFYLGFGPPIVKRVHNGVEYGIGSFPLGGYVKIPGMNRPSPGDLRATLKPEVQQELAPQLDSLDAALDRDDESAALEALEGLRPKLGETRMWQEQEMSLAPDAYWRQAAWRRFVAIAAGPAVNLVFAIVLFTCLFLVATTHDTNVVAAVQSGSPAAAAQIQQGDKILTVAGAAAEPNQIPTHIRATHGAPFTLVVQRLVPTHVRALTSDPFTLIVAGRERHVTVGPLQARLNDGAYRIGVSIEEREGAGESLPFALRDSFKVTWSVIAGTASGLAQTVTGRNTRQSSSAVGIVRVSAAAWRQGLRDFLSILGLISLALGLLNLVPILPLDGGHLVITLVEKLRGRTFAQAVYVRYSLIGMSLLAVLVYFGARNDFNHIFGHHGG